MEQNILLEKRGKTAIVTLNRPSVRNAMNRGAMLELGKTLSFLAEDRDVRAVVLTGSGGSFCAGMDLNDAKDFDAGSALKFSKLLHDACFQMERMGKPVIAAVNGHALGLGLELAMACDVRVASANATFGQPEVKLGIIPGSGGTQRLPLLVGRGNAKEMIFTGDSVTADEAYRMGLVNHVIDEGRAVDESVALADRMGVNSISAIKASKELIDRSSQQDYNAEQKRFSECFGTADQKEGMSAFFAKRKPVFA